MVHTHSGRMHSSMVPPLHHRPFVAAVFLCAFLAYEGHATATAIAHSRPAHDDDVGDAKRLGASVSDLFALESMVSGFTSGMDPSWNENSFTCEWSGVTCNADGYVQSVQWPSRGLTGVLNLTVVPQYIEGIYINNNALTGLALDLSTLPSTLAGLGLNNNAFSAMLSFQNVPPNLQQFNLNLEYNQLSGSPIMGPMPPGFVVRLGYNFFCGDIAVASYTSLRWNNMCIGSLNPTWNANTSILSCPVCSADPHEEDLVAMLSFVSGLDSGRDPSWTAATPACSWVGVGCVNTIVSAIHFTNMTLSGMLNMTLLPRYAQYLQVSSNMVFDGTRLVGWSALSVYPLVVLQLNNNGFIGEVDLLHLPPTLQDLDISFNSFTGTPNLSLLPPMLHQLYVAYNDFCGIIKAANASYFPGNVDGLCMDGIDATWIQEISAYVCPSCSGRL